MRDSDRRFRAQFPVLSSRFLVHSYQPSEGSLLLASRHLQRTAANVTGRHGAPATLPVRLCIICRRTSPIPGHLSWGGWRLRSQLQRPIGVRRKESQDLWVASYSITGNREVRTTS